MDAELRKQPATDERANNSNDEIADDPKSGALHDLAGQPSGNEAEPQIGPAFTVPTAPAALLEPPSLP